MDFTQIGQEVREALNGLLEVANLKQGQIVVVGCSTSEVMGEKIGSASSTEAAAAIIKELLPPLKAKGIYLAVQCCEHLNRAIVVEEEAAVKYGLEIVTVVPAPKAGGSLAAAAMQNLDSPVVVEKISAHAGLDIGDTFIGMHLKAVAVPIRLKIKKIGNAHLTLARTRPKLIGGERARYC
jgi:uncharacterized protein (TIGR01440 family)